MSSQALTTNQITAEAIEKVLLRGDLSSLSTPERLSYYHAVCESVGLNPLTRPLEYLNLSGKLTLYARKDATDQLRKIHSVSIDDVRTERFDDVFVVTAKAKDKEGRQDSATGAVTIGNLKGDALANAIMKAETKAKRRVTLSICGLGLLDETELETIKDIRPIEPIQTPIELTGVILEQTAKDDRYWWKIQNGKMCAVFAYETGSGGWLADYSRLLDQEGKQVTLKVYERGELKGIHAYELADVVKVEPVPELLPTTQVATTIATVSEPVPQKINPICNIDENMLICKPFDVLDSTTKTKAKYVQVHYHIPRIREDHETHRQYDEVMASVFDAKFFDAVRGCARKECVFKISTSGKYTNIVDIVSIAGVPHKDGKPVTQ